MLERQKILDLFELLNTRLTEMDVRAEVGIVGGAAMCLLFKSRAATKDVDAIFEPTELLRKLIREIGEEEGYAGDWMNDAVKGFLPGQPKKQEFLSLSHLYLWTPEPAYILAMKCISARWDTSDRDDVEFLIKHLKLKSVDEVIGLIEDYYRRSQIPAKTRFFIEEIFEKN
jgi:hypothetical protein